MKRADPLAGLVCSVEFDSEELLRLVEASIKRARAIVASPDYVVHNPATQDCAPQFMWVATDHDQQVELSQGMLRIDVKIGDQRCKGRLPVPEKLKHGMSSTPTVLATLASVSAAIATREADAPRVREIRDICANAALVGRLIAKEDPFEVRIAPTSTRQEVRVYANHMRSGRVVMDEIGEPLRAVIEALEPAISLQHGAFGEEWLVGAMFVDDTERLDPMRHAALVRRFSSDPVFGPIIEGSAS